MRTRLRSRAALALQHGEGWFNQAFGTAWNPFYHLGALTVFFFWVVLVSGIYVFVLFETSIFGAFDSVEYMTNEQWYLGGVMRSLHRYASDAAVVTMLLHLGREFLKDRYRGVRWFSWITGVPLLWLVFPLGITGYWLVWDRLAQYVALFTAELLDWLPIFTDPMARNFLTPESLSDRFFTLLAFLHLIGFPIFLVFGIWFHLLRVSRPKVNPPMGLAAGSLLMLLVVSLVKPAVSQGRADLTTMPASLDFDWFYLAGYPLLENGSPVWLWAVLLGSTLVLCLLPWLPPLRRLPVARVDPANCNGCGRCFADCPFGAVIMQPRTDGRRGHALAVVDEDLCTGCGICAGACPSSTPFRSVSELVSGIDMPALTVHDLREATRSAIAAEQDPVKIVVYGCDCAVPVEELRTPGVIPLSLPCTGNVPPSFVDYTLRRAGADGVMLTGCRPNDCYYRLGNRWVDERLGGEREPHLRTTVDRRRLRVFWAAASDRGALERELADFRATLRAMRTEKADPTDGGNRPNGAPKGNPKGVADEPKAVAVGEGGCRG